MDKGGFQILEYDNVILPDGSYDVNCNKRSKCNKMAAATQDELKPLRRRSISDILREFKLANLRVLLLGNSWTERALVGNLLADKCVFNEEAETQRPVKHNVQLKDMTVTIINTADMLHPDQTDDQLSRLVAEAALASNPGPHVFLLVLEPETFTEQHHHWLQLALNKFSEQSFHHAFVLLSRGGQKVLESPHLQSLITECRFRYQWIRHSEDEQLNAFRRKELFTRLARIVKENSGEHLTYDIESPRVACTFNSGTKEKATFPILETLKNIGFIRKQVKTSKSHQEAFHCRVLLVGQSDNKKRNLHKCIISPNPSNQSSSKVDIGEWGVKLLKVVRSADIFSMTVPEVIDEMRRCVRECSPGPNVLLLLVKPSEFTEKQRETLNLILTLFGSNAFKYAIVVFTHKEESDCASRLVSDCEEQFYEMFNENRSRLMDMMETLVHINNGSCITLTSAFTGEEKKHLNLVFCGRQGSGKTSVAQAILDDDIACYPAKSPSKCTVHRGTVSGRMVSIVELPALSGKTQKEMMEECLRCISICDPDGVHAFVMVLPLKALTDEDKAEFKAIQNTFSSRINNSTVILFTVESDPKSKAVAEFVTQHEEIQTLCKSCRAHIFFNINDQTQVPQVLKELEKSRNCYTMEMFAEIQIERFTQMTSSETRGKRSEKTLRIVLIGKTGRGKSSSGNTILGRDVFKCDFGQKATTKSCVKEHSKLKRCYVDVVDTPGLFDMSMSNHDINDEMMKCISLLSPGPHVFLLVLGIGRFTPEENETLNLIKKGFGKDAQKYTIVLFTHGDVLEKKETSIEEFIKDKCDILCQKLISDCGNRFHVFNNLDESQKQVDELIQKIEALVEENGGSCYTNEMLKEAEAAIQEEVQKLLREKEEELRREMQQMKDKHKREIQEIQTKMEKDRKETEKVREEKDRELEEMKTQIRKDREQWKKNQKKKEKEYRKGKQMEEEKRQEYEQTIQKLEENIKLNFDLKTQETKDKIQQERKVWEEERREREKQYQEDKKRWQEEQKRLEKQEEKYKEKLETWTKEREIDEQRRAQELHELKEEHNQQIKDLKRKFEDEAREKAEQFNEFIKKKEIDFAARIDEHLKEVKRLKDDIKQKEGEYVSLENLKTESETTLKNSMKNLQTTHKQELIDLAIVALMEEKENHKKIKEVQKTHKQELKRCEKEISDQFEKERKTKVGELKEKQNQEMKNLEENTTEDDLQLKKKELSENHKQQLENLESELWSEHKQKLESEVDKIKKKHEKEMNKITKNLLEKNKEYWTKQTSDLEKKQQEEMDAFMKKAGEKVNEVELDRLRTKHQIEMDQIKKRMFFEEGWCSIL